MPKKSKQSENHKQLKYQEPKKYCRDGHGTWSKRPGLDQLIARAVRRAIRAFVDTKGSLSIVRNAGWEQHLRNLILIELEKKVQDASRVIGLSEATVISKNGSRANRIDLIMRCRQCGKFLVAIETKLNLSHPNQHRYIAVRPAEACKRLEKIATSEFGGRSYMVYIITEHSLPSGGGYRENHNKFATKYKEFDSRGFEILWPKEGSKSTFRSRNVSVAGISPETCGLFKRKKYKKDASVAIKAWIARVTKRKSGFTLSFVNQNGEPCGSGSIPHRRLSGDRREAIRPYRRSRSSGVLQ